MTERKDPVIAIDGPAGVGKSTAAARIAKDLGFILVDTGALYRGVALAAQERGIEWSDADALAVLATALDLGFVNDPNGNPLLFIDGKNRSGDIRTPEISQGASQVSAHPGVRNALLNIQRILGRNGGVVLEGRDIGTVIFPDAEVKVFLTASPEERAKRRVRDLEQRGMKAAYDETLAGIQDRDHRDSTRPVAPLRPADDATIVDTTTLSLDEVLAILHELVDRWRKGPENPSEV
ncbi:MAG: (d)CMP kinase [Polyangiales bacterium]